MRAIALCALLLAAPIPAISEQITISGEVISPGAAPYTESMDQMILRDEHIQTDIAAGLREPMPPVIILPPPRQHSIGPERPVPNVSIGGGLLPTRANAPQTISSSFIAMSLSDSGYIPPDSMGAIGPDHYTEVINGAVGVFDRNGTRLAKVTLASFFTVVVGGVTYPRGGAFDPRVIYDRRSGRWFASALEFGTSNSNNNIMLAVSASSDPTASWSKYVIPVGQSKIFSDYDTLGTDDNGVYFSCNMFGSSFSVKVAATPKAPLIAPSPSLGPVTQFGGIVDVYASLQPAHNQDAVGPSDPAWFVSSANRYDSLVYRTLTWSGGTPSLSSTTTVSSPSFSDPPSAPALGSTTNVDTGDFRMQMAVIRNGQLWTCRTIGVNSSGGSTSADRTACEWLNLDVSAAPGTLIQSGRVYDSAASGFRFYYYPSVMVNGQGNVAMSFSGSRSSEYIGAYTCGRLATDPIGTMQSITQIQAGQASYTVLDANKVNRWGDYSASSLDPNDDMTIWTIQEYATTSTNVWGTVVARLTSPPPIANNPNGSGCAGQNGNMLSITGSGFYDPGPGYTNRLTVQLSGGIVNGISNYSVIYNGPTSITVFFDIAANASPGTRTIIITNPDGRSTSVPSGFTVLSPASITSQPGNQAACTGESVQFCIGASGSSLKYQWKKNGLPISGATTSCYSIPSAGPADAGSYTCTVSNSCSTATSSEAVLTVSPCENIPAAKQMGDGSSIAIKGKLVSIVLPDSFYIEEDDRTAGLLVVRPGHGLSTGSRVDVSGLLGTNSDGERYLGSTVIGTVVTGQPAVQPLGLANRWLGGADWMYSALTGAGQKGVLGGVGLNNIGLLVRVWGQVTYVDPGGAFAYLDDGSHENDGNMLGLLGSAVPGIRIVPAGSLTVGDFASLTGASSLATVGGNGVRVLQVGL
jgi:hypothetical protein